MKKILLLLFSIIFISCSKNETIIVSPSKFSSPLKEEYKISSGQGIREIYCDGLENTIGLYHNGIDFACPDKTKVYAAKEGKVITVYPGYYNGEKWKGHRVYGGMIEIEHPDGTFTRYAHLSQTLKNEGEMVERGEQIGLSGGIKGRRASGISTGAHLHFEIIMDICSWVE